MNDMNPNKRKSFISLLIANYNPKRADLFISNYENGVDQAVVFTSEAKKYWEKKWVSQSKEERDKFKNTPSMLAKRGGVWKSLEDIRDWDREAKVEDSRLKGDICWVTGISRLDLMDFGGLCDDRYDIHSFIINPGIDVRFKGKLGSTGTMQKTHILQHAA
jgi:hypothetical protein